MSKGQTWLGRLQSEYLVGCGAHDDRLFDAGGDKAGYPEMLNLTNPALIRRIYEEYADAGATLMATNTTAANALCLRRCGMESKLREINLAGARLAVESAGNATCVAGSIGPFRAGLNIAARHWYTPKITRKSSSNLINRN